MEIILYKIIIVLFFIISGFLFFFFKKKSEKERISKELNMVLFLIMMPKYDFLKKEKELSQEEERKLIGQMEQIYTNFLYLKKPKFFQKIIQGSPSITFEIASQIGGSDISFYIAAPKFLETDLEKYIHGTYPKAVIEKVPQDYTIFEPNGVTVGSYLKLESDPFFPINTYKNLEKNPLSAITNALTKINVDEGAAIQIVIRPLFSNFFKKRGDKILSKIRQGISAKTAIAETSRSFIEEFLTDVINLFIKSPEKPEEKREKIEIKKSEINEKIIQAIENKIQKQVFETNIRLITAAQNQERAEQILNHLQAAFSQFSLSGLNSFQSIEIKKNKLKKLIYDFSFRNFNSVQKNILNIEELTSIYHFPIYHFDAPYIKTAKTGASAPPIELPEKGLVLIGKVSFRGEEKKVYFASKADRRRHFYIIGQTGVGKSNLLSEMIRQDIEQGRGVAVIDPHGELIEATLTNIPKQRIEDVILFEPFDLERPIGLNMLEYDTPEQKDFAVQEMIAIFYKLFPPEMIGPMFEHYMRNAMLALMADKEDPGTLVEIPRIFTDPDFMKTRLEKVTDPIVRNFWIKEWQQTTGQTRSDMLGYVVSKVGRFIENEMMRNIIGQSHSGFNLEEIMNQEKIFLVNLSKGLTGEVNSSLLGLILVSKIQMAAMKRARISEEERKDFYLYVDEFQNFTTDSIVTILSEARKYRLNLILAHQYIPQLKEEIRNAVLGNVGTIAAFRIGVNDAEFLEKQFEPEFFRFDLVNLDNFNLIVKMLIENKVSSPFKMQTYPAQKGDLSIIQPIREMSRLKYGRIKAIIEQEIAQRSKLLDI
jgi:hypothetical protein